MRIRIAWILSLVVSGGLGPLTSAQEFRIYTTVTDQSPVDAGKGKPIPLTTSLTLFHAGKIYDYIEAAEETVIHEPTQNRFLVLSRRHDLATEISHDEIRRYLGLARSQAGELIAEWQKSGSDRRGDIAVLEFQLTPKFEVRVDERTKTLSLIGSQLRYDVKYSEGPSPDLVQAYLKSADWTAQLNSVLHPGALLPEPRLRVDDELRARGVLPVEVDLRIVGSRPVHLKASHEWTWKLIQRDRALIDNRETLIRQPGFDLVPFLEFQQQTLKAEVGKR